MLDAGFDYVELPAQALPEREEDFRAFHPEATNLFFRGDIKLYGQEQTPYQAYAQRLVESAARLGVQTMVIGSGGSRRAPEGYAPELAEAAFVRVAAEVADIAEPLGIAIAPESLNRTETNVGNDLRVLATQLQVLGVGYTADAYHVLVEWVFDGNEAAPTLEHWRDALPHLPTHVHLASRDRWAPLPADADLLGFVSRLSELGYDGRISLECKRKPDDDWVTMLINTKSLFGVA